MDRLPEDIVGIIIQHLTSNEIFSNIKPLSKYFYSLLQSPYILNQIITHQINATHPLHLNSKDAMVKIRRLSNEKRFRTLKFTGFGTTGGVDDDLSCYWVANMFKPDSSSYCSKIEKNINCVAVQQITQPKEYTKRQKKARIMAAHLIRDNPLLSKIAQSKCEKETDLLPIEERLYIEAWEENRDILDISSKYSVRDKNEIYKVLKDCQIKVKKLYKDENTNTLVKEIDHNSVSQYNSIACIKKLIINREGDYSCPLSVFLIFISDFYIDIDSALFSVYDNIFTLADLTALTEMEKSVPGLFSTHRDNNFEYSIFKRCKSELKPLAWGRFKTPMKDLAMIKLQQMVSGKYLYVKLIACENRMARLHDHHETTNIDCTYVGVQGVEIKVRSV